MFKTVVFLSLFAFVATLTSWGAFPNKENSESSGSSESYVTRGKACNQKKDYVGAIKNLNKAIELDPKNSDAWLFRGNAFYAQKKLEQARKDYEKVLEMLPDKAIAWSYLANTLLAQKKYDEAIKDYDKAIKLNPQNANFYICRGIAYGNKKDFETAIKNYDKVIELKPNYIAAWVMRAKAKQQKEDFSGAIDDYRQSLILQPNALSILNDYAWALAICPVEKLRNPTLAVKIAKKCCDATKWRVASLLDTLAVSYAATGDFEKAVETQKKAIELIKDKERRKGFEKRLELFKNKKPYLYEHEKTKIKIATD